MIHKNGRVIGIEVKSGSSVQTGGMQAFSKKFRPDKVLLIGDDGFPWQEFLSINPADLFDIHLLRIIQKILPLREVDCEAAAKQDGGCS